MSIALSSVSAFTAAVAAARSVDLGAYTLHGGAVRNALLSAARAGAAVRVRLERDPLDDAAGTLHAANADTVARLSAAGADAALTPAGAPVLHLKAAVVDGVAWLDDRNWTGDAPETVLRDTDQADVNAVTSALDGRPGVGSELRTTKAAAQALEADLIRNAGAAAVDVESESFGAGSIGRALLSQARAGSAVRLLVAGREALAPGPAGESERRRLAALAAAGVEVRTGDPRSADFDEKLAIVGSGAWAGSANATFTFGPAGEQRDWGLVSGDPVLVDGLRAAFERNWSAAKPLPDATLTTSRCAHPSASTSSTRRPALNCEPPSTSAWTSR